MTVDWSMLHFLGTVAWKQNHITLALVRTFLMKMLNVPAQHMTQRPFAEQNPS